MCMLIFAVYATNQAKDYTPREKLAAEACISVSNIIDDQVDWITDTKTVKSAMDYFYDKTGVQPYLLICDNLEGKGGEITDEEAEDSLKTLYDRLFSDEGHMIFTFMEYADSEYITYLYTGRSADSVIDADARDIFLNNADRYYTDSSLSDEEYFAKVFKNSADSIMKDAAGSASAARTCVTLSVIAVVVMVGGFICFKVAEQKKETAKEMKEILKTPVSSTLDSPEDEELKRKYQNESGGN